MLIKISKDKGDSDSCIRYAVQEYAGFFGCRITLPINILRADGKPILDGLPYFVSFSHTKDFKACVVSDKAVGVDIERMTTGRDYHSLSKRFFAPDEATKNRYKFYKLWTAKEALKKLIGVPLPEALRLTDYTGVRHFDFINGIALSVAGEGSFFIVLFFADTNPKQD